MGTPLCVAAAEPARTKRAEAPLRCRAGCGQSYRGEKKRLVIIGAGFGGVTLAKALEPSNLDITLIAPVDYFNTTWGTLRSVVRLAHTCARLCVVCVRIP